MAFWDKVKSAAVKTKNAVIVGHSKYTETIDKFEVRVTGRYLDNDIDFIKEHGIKAWADAEKLARRGFAPKKETPVAEAKVEPVVIKVCVGCTAYIPEKAVFCPLCRADQRPKKVSSAPAPFPLADNKPLPSVKPLPGTPPPPMVVPLETVTSCKIVGIGPQKIVEKKVPFLRKVLNTLNTTPLVDM